jgi:hypothetical protein
MERLALAGRPIFLRSPQRGNNYSSQRVYGSTFRIRYFPPGSLSFEPLGTGSIMRQTEFRVKMKRAAFLKKYLVWKEWLTGGQAWMDCG